MTLAVATIIAITIRIARMTVTVTCTIVRVAVAVAVVALAVGKAQAEMSFSGVRILRFIFVVLAVSYCGDCKYHQPQSQNSAKNFSKHNVYTMC